MEVEFAVYQNVVLPKSDGFISIICCVFNCFTWFPTPQTIHGVLQKVFSGCCHLFVLRVDQSEASACTATWLFWYCRAGRVKFRHPKDASISKAGERLPTKWLHGEEAVGGTILQLLRCRTTHVQCIRAIWMYMYYIDGHPPPRSTYKNKKNIYIVCSVAAVPFMKFWREMCAQLSSVGL